MRAVAVIGAAFGDEGKGAVVDALTASATGHPVVIRYNGGAQAGHTVVLPDGTRHVFSHFGSGTFAGATTFLSRYFVANPRIFLNEHYALQKLCNIIQVVIDPAAEITTPFDVQVNRLIETNRGAKRHGSVGIGFGETIERASRGLSFQAGVALGGPAWKLRQTLERIQAYARGRLDELGIPLHSEDSLLFGLSSIQEFMGQLDAMRGLIAVGNLNKTAERSPVIFEGAQGLLLDQHRGFRFPHVTRSNTGMKNITALVSSLGIKGLDVIYVTRPYTTRHGAGPLVGEVPGLDGIRVVDETNITKPWQGSLRLASLMGDHIQDAIDGDLGDAPKNISLDAGIFISCLDQIENSSLKAARMNWLGSILPLVGEGFGPRRDQRGFYKERRRAMG